ncbi:GFA family protein [Oceaniglobus trochenteri]|uniref:GFA family protein n=1 Tax=Oceaniglobus trochenteri TaxID=2763260 RepID=UPI001D000189|nr:GFA family protein [Oceaniglobus trochenteri]
MTQKSTGGCLCGAVRYTLAERPEGLHACHCSMCRRHTGGIALAVSVAPGGIVFQSDAALRVHATSDWAERAFCGTCGSSLFWRLTAPGPAQGNMALYSGTLDDLEGLELIEEIYVDHKPEGYAFAGERKRMTEAEVLAQFGIGDAT